MVSAGGAAKEYYLGYESYRMLTSLLDNFDSEFESIGRSVAGLRKKYLTASRLLVSVTGKADNQFLQRIIDIFEKGEKKTIPVSDFPLLKAEKTAFIVPARVGYAVRLSNLSLLDFEPTGALSVIRNLLSYEYLWGTIRVQGGAYGTGFITNIFDNIGFYSYRDPTPDRSLTEYSGSGDFLREFARGGGDITKFIIGAVGDSDQLLSPSVRGLIGTRRYLLSKTQDELDEFRNQQISTSAEELLRIAELCDRVNREGVICVVGGKDKISRFGEYFDKVITV
jgi:Zn-dependent M16 (insulinase) family peptidase